MLIEVAVTLLAPIVLFFIIGLYVDRMTQTVPILTIVLTFFGFITGMWMLYKKYAV